MTRLTDRKLGIFTLVGLSQVSVGTGCEEGFTEYALVGIEKEARTLNIPENLMSTRDTAVVIRFMRHSEMADDGGFSPRIPILPTKLFRESFFRTSSNDR